MSINTPIQITVPFAAAGLKNTIPAVANPVDGHAGYDVGFPAINMTPKVAGGIPPFGQDFNGIFFEMTTAIRYLEAGGTFPYNSTFVAAVGGYPIGAIVSRADRGGLWINLVADNATNPDAGGAGWSALASGNVVGSSRNIKMTVATASASAALTADEIIVKTILGGSSFCLPSFNKTINLAVTGAGGMDTGLAPASGFVSIYAIFNPATGVSALLACAQATSSGPVYTGANMPAGYTASALVSALRTTAARLLDVFVQIDRKISIIPTSIISTTVNQTNVSISIAAVVPAATKTISGGMSCSTTASSGVSVQLASNNAAVGAQYMSVSPPSGAIAPLIAGVFSDLSMSEVGIVYLSTSAGAGALATTANIHAYTI